MKVVAVFEESAGYLTTAVSMKAAWQYLVREGWLTFDDGVRFSDGYIVDIAYIFEINGWNQTQENLVRFAMSRNEEEWEDAFAFVETFLVEEE